MKSVILCGCMMWMCFSAFSQDLTFSQFYEKPLLRNPALAGVFDGDIRISGVHRNQWQSVTVPFQTSALSAELKFPLRWNDWITIGLQTTHDVAGDVKMSRTQLLPVINYHKSLSDDKDNFISMAFMGGIVNSQFDPTKLKMDEQFQNGSYNPGAPIQTFSRSGFTYWDAGTGLTYNSGFGEDSRYYVGAALFHFNKPKVAFYTDNTSTTLTNKWVLNAGINAAMTEINRLIVFADLYIQGGNKQLFGGAMYETVLSEYYDNADKFAFSVGGFYRWNDAFIPVVKLEMYKWTLGLSYDANVSKLKTASNFRGGFELTATYKSAFTRRAYESDKVRCHF